MKDTATAFEYNLTNLSRSNWTTQIEDIADDFGDSEPVGADHTALLIDAGRSLMVSFESVATVRGQNDGAAPIGWGFVQSHGWSSLTLLANNDPDWFRTPAIYGYFDRMIDDGFFDDFDQILFYGAGAAGYAAAAFSVCAPETQVLVIQPQSTLDPARAKWDRRFPQTRRLDFKTRFGYAPLMVETADKVTVIHDPSILEDAMHAQMFDAPNTTHLTCPYIGPDAQRAMRSMDFLPDLIEQAMDGTLEPASYAELWRARHQFLPFLRTLMHRVEGTERHDRLLARLCRHVGADGKRPLFQEKFAALEAKGVTL